VILFSCLSQYGMADNTSLRSSPFSFYSQGASYSQPVFDTGIYIGSQNHFIKPYYEYSELKESHLCVQNLDAQLKTMSQEERKSLARQLSGNREIKSEAKIKVNIYGKEFAGSSSEKVRLTHIEVLTSLPNLDADSNKRVTIIIPIGVANSCDVAGLSQSLRQAIYLSQNDARFKNGPAVYDLKTLQKEVYAKNNDRVVRPIPASYNRKSSF